jgi:hypothetical protein
MKLIVYDNDVLQVVVVMVEKPEALREKGIVSKILLPNPNPDLS